MRQHVTSILCLSVCSLGFGCGSNLESTDTVVGTGGSEGGVEDENSSLCAPFEVAETGGEEPFPPDGESAFLYACEGGISVDISGQICLQGSGSTCDAGLPMLPTDEISQDEVAIGIPSPDFTSTADMDPQPAVGACCVAEAQQPEEPTDALDTVCAADCGARACKAAAEELAAIVADEACFWETFDLDACHLALPIVCDGICVQSEILGRTINDLNFVLSELQRAEVFEQCSNSIRSPSGWRPCLTADPNCMDPPSEIGPGRIVELKFTADCGGLQPVLLDNVACEFNVNANPGAALPGEGFGGPLVSGTLSLDTPLGVAATAIVGSSIGFRRLDCESDTCPFTLTNLEVDFDDFTLGPIAISGLHAELVEPAVGVVRSDTTATIEDGAMRLEITYGVSVSGKKFFGGKPLPKGGKLVAITNDGPVAMIIEPDNRVEVLNASFVFPFNIGAQLTTAPAQCTPQQ